VLPDYPVRISLEEIECRNGDKVLNYTLQLIEENKYIERPKIETAVEPQQIDIEDENNGGNRKWFWIIAAVLLLLVIVKIIKNKK
jgi:hypothetical protein